jgi:hypothetical protein
MLATKAINTLVGLLAFCQLAVAFYPWTPDYRCARDPNCHHSKRSNVPEVDGRATTFKLRQRLPEVSSISLNQLLAVLTEAVLGAAGCPSSSPS